MSPLVRNEGGDGERAPLRVLVVDDSETQRAILAALFNAAPGLAVIGRAASGQEALRLAATLHPDVITIDLRMPGLDGIEATRRIMQETPTPVVMIAAGISPDDRQLVSAALAAGVLAILPKPTPGPRGVAAAAELVATVRRMADVRVIRRWSPERILTGQLRPPAAFPAGALGGVAPAPLAPPAAFAGGGSALRPKLPLIPATFLSPIVIVQHIASGFAASLIDWLAPQCALPFQLVTTGMRLDRPGIYLAPTGQHLVVQGQTLALTDQAAVRGHRPSATVLFNSVAVSYGARAIGILLTGMGDDGAAGLAEMKRLGGITIAQDEASSVVFGMPAAAIALGVVDHIVAPSQIPALLARLVSGEVRRPARGLLPSHGTRE